MPNPLNPAQMIMNNKDSYQLTEAKITQGVFKNPNPSASNNLPQ